MATEPAPLPGGPRPDGYDGECLSGTPLRGMPDRVRDATPHPVSPPPDGLAQRLRAPWKVQHKAAYFAARAGDTAATMAEAADALDSGAQRVAVLESLLTEVVDAWCSDDCDHADVYYAVEGLARSGALSAAFPGRRIWQAPTEAREAVSPTEDGGS